MVSVGQLNDKIQNISYVCENKWPLNYYHDYTNSDKDVGTLKKLRILLISKIIIIAEIKFKNNNN